MIDMKARRKAGEVLRHYLSARITNFESENAFPYAPHDRGLTAVGRATWYLHSDLVEHGFDWGALPRVYQRELTRWVAFLYTGAEYLWPDLTDAGVFHWPESDHWLHRTMRWVRGRLGFTERREEQECAFKLCGAYEAWPFITVDQLIAATEQPVLLNGQGIEHLPVTGAAAGRQHPATLSGRVSLLPRRRVPRR